MPEKIIECFNLTKKYRLKGKNQRNITALNNINLHINEGEIFGLLGPNGAGKTTLVQCLTTLILPTSGYATIDGYDIVSHPLAAKKNISLMLGSGMLYFRLTAFANLKFFCRIYKVPFDKERIFRVAKEFGLENWLDQYVEKFSSGMKTKLALCRTFLINRRILFLDEPTIGLDVTLKHYMIQKIKNLNKTIFFSSHDMGVVEDLCDRIAFINKGSIIKIGKKKDLKELLRKDLKIEVKILDEINELKSELNQQDYVSDVVKKNHGLEIIINNRHYFNKLLLILGKYKVSHLKEIEISLEDLFTEFNK